MEGQNKSTTITTLERGYSFGTAHVLQSGCIYIVYITRYRNLKFRAVHRMNQRSSAEVSLILISGLYL